MFGTYIHKFELKNGHKVFVPSRLARQTGETLRVEVQRRWRSPRYFFHLREGGHVGALKAHLTYRVFATLDISGFFDSVTRSKIHRALRSIGIGHERAREIAQESTVEKNLRRRDFSLPYGFVQSPILASLALDKSALGRAMSIVARSNHTRLSCYVDDVILSGIEEEALETSRLVLIRAAEQSGFVINPIKSQPCASEITAFNIDLSNGQMVITGARMHKFEKEIAQSTTHEEAAGIVGYVYAVNPVQGEVLARIAAGSPEEDVRDAVRKYVG